MIPPCVHKRTGKDEEGHGEQGEGVDAGHETLGDDLLRDVPDEDDGDARREADRGRDGNAERQQDDEKDPDEGQHQTASGVRSGSCPRRTATISSTT